MLIVCLLHVICTFPLILPQPNFILNPTTHLKLIQVKLSRFVISWCVSSIKTLRCTLTVYIWMSMALEFPYKMTFSPSTPPTVPSKEEECPSSDACSIVHALPPICSPHSAASAETLRRLKGQIAHTKRERKTEVGQGWWGKDMERRGERGGGRKGLTLFTAMQLWSAFEPGGVLWQPLSLFLSPSLSVL